MALAARQLTEEERALRGKDHDANSLAGSRRVAHVQADIAWLQGLMGRRNVAGGAFRQSA